MKATGYTKSINNNYARVNIVFVIISLIISINAKAQNVYRLNNRFDTEKFDKLYKLDSKNKRSITPKKMAQSLKGYIKEESEDRDTLYIKFWSILDKVTRKKYLFNSDTSYTRTGRFTWRKEIPDPYKGNPAIINSDDNGSTFAYYIKWEKDKYFKVPFSARSIAATNIPFRYRIKKHADLEAEFLNVGINLFFIHGATKFFKHEQIEERQSYWGYGPFVAFSQEKLDSDNTNGKVATEKQVARISYGFSGTRSWNGFSVILAIGFDNAFGSNGKHWEENNFKSGLHPWAGFGFGFGLTELAFKAKNDSK